MPPTATPPLPSRRDVLVAVGYSVVIWMIATRLLVTAGTVLIPDAGAWSGVPVIIMFGLLALGVAIVGYLLFRKHRSESMMLRLLFGTTISTTGLLLDAIVYGATAGQYPTLSENQQGPVAFFLVLAYGLLLIAPHLCPQHAPDAAAS